ncbi:MAG: gamma-glutamyl-gamma-aminobutyrate hydrolase family protein [bacterium]
MRILLIDNGTTLLEKLKKLIPGEESVIKAERFQSSQAEQFDVVILSGSSVYSLNENENNFTEELKFIRESGKSIIGICFGCELIAKTFGGTLGKLENKEKGEREIEILNPSLSNKQKARVYESHELVITKLPDDFEIQAESAAGPEIIKHKTLPIYGLQFHPENFVDQLEGDEVFLKILNSL